MKGEREAGGMRCSEVLAVLSDYVDGTLDAAERSRIDAHLRGCDACERFGGSFAATVRTLREQLRGEERLDDGTRERLRKITRKA